MEGAAAGSTSSSAASIPAVVAGYRGKRNRSRDWGDAPGAGRDPGRAPGRGSSRGGLAGRPVELRRALARAFCDDDLEKRWLRGEDVFSEFPDQ